jgi:hypothetical protein
VTLFVGYIALSWNARGKGTNIYRGSGRLGSVMQYDPSALSCPLKHRVKGESRDDPTQFHLFVEQDKGFLLSAFCI